LLNTLAGGLDMYKAESALGRDYPPTTGSGTNTTAPSTWNTTLGGDPYGHPTYTASGAQTLVWGLAGADMLGTPGFPATGRDTDDGLWRVLRDEWKCTGPAPFRALC